MILARRFPASGLLVFIPTLILVTGCQKGGVAQSRLSASVPGREVVAVLDAPGFISGTQDGGVTVTFAGKKVEVERARILIDTVAKAEVPEGAKKVEIRSSRGALTIKADGKTIYTSSP